MCYIYVYGALYIYKWSLRLGPSGQDGRITNGALKWKIFYFMSGGMNNRQNNQRWWSELVTYSLYTIYYTMYIIKLGKNIWKIKTHSVPLWKPNGLPDHTSVHLSACTRCFKKAYLICLLYIYIYTRVGTLIVATIYLKLIQNIYMFRSFTVLQCSHQHCVQPVASDVEVVGYL